MNDWPLWLARTPNGSVPHLVEQAGNRSLCNRAVRSPAGRWDRQPYGICRTCLARAAAL